MRVKRCLPENLLAAKWFRSHGAWAFWCGILFPIKPAVWKKKPLFVSACQLAWNQASTLTHKPKSGTYAGTEVCSSCGLIFPACRTFQSVCVFGHYNEIFNETSCAVAKFRKEVLPEGRETRETNNASCVFGPFDNFKVVCANQARMYWFPFCISLWKLACKSTNGDYWWSDVNTLSAHKVVRISMIASASAGREAQTTIAALNGSVAWRGGMKVL